MEFFTVWQQGQGERKKKKSEMLSITRILILCCSSYKIHSLTLKTFLKGIVGRENRWTKIVSKIRFTKCPAKQAAAILQEKH